MRHAASLRLETAATHGSAFAVSKSALSIHSYVDMGGVGPPSEKNRFSASTASADEPNTHFVHSVADFNNLSNAKVKTGESRIFGHRPALLGHPSANGRENVKRRPLAGQSGLVIHIELQPQSLRQSSAVTLPC